MVTSRAPRARKQAGASVTIQSVAKAANVSAMTVSHVINGTKSVQDQTREAVLKAVKDLGYVPNLAARQLASADAIRIGIVYRSAQNAFLSAMLVGCLNAASRFGLQVQLRKCDTFDADEALEAVAGLQRSGANALLLSPPYCEILAAAGLPETFGLPISAIAQGSPLDGMDCVGIDEAGAAADMTEHLIQRGHRRIGFVTGPRGHSASEERLKGYREACARHAMPDDAGLVAEGNFSFESGLAAAEKLLDLEQRPTAIFASNDDMAAAVSLVAHRRGLSVPGDLSIAGFDDAPIAVKIWPPLTTVRQEVEALAERGVEMLVQRSRAQRNRRSGNARPDMPPASLSERTRHRIIVRDST